MSLAEAGEEEIVAARRAFEADLEKSPAPQENGGAATPQQQSEGWDGRRNLDEEVSTCAYIHARRQDLAMCPGYQSSHQRKKLKCVNFR